MGGSENGPQGEILSSLSTDAQTSPAACKWLNQTMEKLAALKARQPGGPAPIALAMPTSSVSLPQWPDAVRGVSNIALRSALFGAIKKGPRPFLERQEVHSQKGIKIVYTGARLDQGDLDVWETVLHIARSQPLGDECRVTAYKILQLLGKTDSGQNRDTLQRRLSRMKATAIEVAIDVRDGVVSYEGSLIDDVTRKERTSQKSRDYVIRLNPKLSKLYARNQFTHVDWCVRQALDGKPLAQWLHGFYASHAKPHPMNRSTLLKMSGSENEDKHSAHQTLAKAFQALSKASNEHEQPFSFTIIGESVAVVKTPSRSQRIHLAKKARAASNTV